MLDFFQSPVTQTVLIALNQGFLVTLELFFVTLIGALPLGPVSYTHLTLPTIA